MGIRFRKSIKIANGVKLNISKSGVSLSLGKNGLHYTINSKGQSTATASLPGTGVSYQKRFNVFGGLKKLFTSKEDNEDVKYIEDKNEVVSINNDDGNKYNDYLEYVNAIKSFHKEVSSKIEWDVLAKGEIPENISEDGKLNILNARVLANKVLSKDLDTYLEVLEKYSPINEISAFGSEFEFGCDNGETMITAFNVKIEEVIPKIGFKKSESGKISEYKLKSSQYNDLAQDYVCSCAIRIAREVFALLPVDYVVVNAEDYVFDSSTGNQRDATILSVLFVRSGFDNINFDLIDPSDFVSRFKSNMSFTKTNGFKEVKEIEVPEI